MIENGLDFPSFYFMKITAVLESMNDFLKWLGSNFCCFALLMIGNGSDLPIVSFYFMKITSVLENLDNFLKLLAFETNVSVKVKIFFLFAWNEILSKLGGRLHPQNIWTL